jgi:hypothetical protein
VREFGKRLRGWTGFEKIQGDLGFQILKDLQRPRIVLLKSDPDLIDKTGFLASQTLVISSEHLKLLGRNRIGLKDAQMSVIGPQKLGQDPSIKAVRLRWAHPKPIPGAIQSFGIDRINHHAVIQKKIHNPPVRLFDGRPKLDSILAALIEPTPQLSQLIKSVLNFLLLYFSSTLITDVKLMGLVGPIHSQIMPWQLLFLLSCVWPIPIALNGKLALYRSSTGRLSIEPSTPFSYSVGQPLPDLQTRWGRVGPHRASS